MGLGGWHIGFLHFNSNLKLRNTLGENQIMSSELEVSLKAILARIGSILKLRLHLLRRGGNLYEKAFPPDILVFLKSLSPIIDV